MISVCFVGRSSELVRTSVTPEVAGSSPVTPAKITEYENAPRIVPNLLPGALGDRREKEDRLHDIAVELASSSVLHAPRT